MSEIHRRRQASGHGEKLKKSGYGTYLLNLLASGEYTVQFIKADIPDVVILEPRVFEDERGFFFESYNQKKFDKVIGHSVIFVQDNHSRSVKGTLRGLHYQLPPHVQGKLVRVTQGEVFDVVVDIRKSSPTFSKWVGVILSADNNRQLWVPPGFAHGFLVTSNVAEFQYKCTDFYAPDCEACIRWDDADLAIEWPLSSKSPLISQKDRNASFLLEAEVFSSSTMFNLDFQRDV